MTVETLDCSSCALAIQSALSTSPASPPFLVAATNAPEDGPPEALGLLSHLLQPSFLNGSDDTASVWAALDALIQPVPLTSVSPNPGVPTTALLSIPFFRSTSDKKEENEPLADVLDDGSICVSFPLSPSTAEPTDVQAVPYEVTLVDVEVDETGMVRPSSRADEKAGRRKSDDGGRWWSLGWGKGGDEMEKGKKLKKVQRAKMAKKVFYPPKDRVSVRCSWWGYEIFISEEAFLKLEKGIEPVATALQSLAAGLTLLSTNLPSALASLPGGLLLKSLLPLLSTIIASLSWYWKTVKGKDRGDGVILAATWLLPMAVVPRTLDRGKWPALVGAGEGKVEEEGRAGEKGAQTGEAELQAQGKEAGEVKAKAVQEEEETGQAARHGRKKSAGGLQRVLSLTRRP